MEILEGGGGYLGVENTSANCDRWRKKGETSWPCSAESAIASAGGSDTHERN